MPFVTRDAASGRLKLGPVGSWRDTAGRVVLRIPLVKYRDTIGRFHLQLAVLAVQLTSLTGLELLFFGPNAAGNSFANNGRVLFEVKNQGVTTRTLTFKSQRPCDQGVLHDQIVSIDPGKTRTIGPFAVARFNDQSLQTVTVLYDNIVGLTVAVYSPP